MKIPHLHTKKRNTKAFTLVELMLVLVILATLAAIVLPKLTGKSQQAKITAAKTQISSFSTALEAFEVDNSYFPKSGDLDALVNQPANATSWHGPYLQSIPPDPWGNPYTYESPGKHNPTGFDLMSNGPDGRAGTDDDITNWDDSKK